MRRLFTALLILFSVTCAAFFLQWHLSSSAQRVLSTSQPLREALLSENQEESLRCADTFLSLWDEEKDWLYFLMQHTHLDEAEESSVNLRHSILVEDFSAALSELTNIEHTLLYLVEKDKPTPKNIF